MLTTENQSTTLSGLGGGRGAGMERVIPRRHKQEKENVQKYHQAAEESLSYQYVQYIETGGTIWGKQDNG